uniref:Uncharacterized protein n=1 Tax=Arundo donax TaxID=35708 RepID=A0A0A9D439_ARUDO
MGQTMSGTNRSRVLTVSKSLHIYFKLYLFRYSADTYRRRIGIRHGTRCGCGSSLACPCFRDRHSGT